MIPEPATLEKGRHAGQKYPFDKLISYGDYVDIPAKRHPHIHSIRCAAHIWARKNGFKVATRKYEGGIRVYRADDV